MRTATIPSDPGRAGQDEGDKLYICRGWYKGGLHPGKVARSSSACHIGWGGHEERVNPFEVLVSEVFNWTAASGGSVPSGAVAAGEEYDGARLYICRGKYRNGIHPGKVGSTLVACHIGWYGKEV